MLFLAFFALFSLFSVLQFSQLLYLCHAVVLGDSVLGFHKHGMQGLSLATNEVG